jgi:hypothetical protein
MLRGVGLEEFIAITACPGGPLDFAEAGAGLAAGRKSVDFDELPRLAGRHGRAAAAVLGSLPTGLP